VGDRELLRVPNTNLIYNFTENSFYYPTPAPCKHRTNTINYFFLKKVD